MLTSRIYQWAQAGPERTAVIYNDTPISYASFSRAIEDVRVLLEEQGLPAGGVAIVLAKNLLQAWMLDLALRALGLTSISVQSIAQAEELKVRNVACVVVIKRERDAHDLGAKSLAGIKVIVVSTVIRPEVDPDSLPELPDNPPAFGGHIVYTSGTTGSYKKLLLAGANDAQRNDWWARKLSLTSGTVFHIVGFGLWTAAGFGFPAAVWQAGGCVVMDQRKDPLKKLFRHRITNAFLMPDMVAEAVEAHGSAPRVDFELTTAGGFLPLAVAEKVIGRLTDRLKISYASTECIAVLRAEFRAIDDLYWLTPYSERIVQVVDENGNECPPDEEGDLRVLLRDIDCAAYLDDAETSARFFRDGYFYPGDMAVKRADGRFRILGRTADVLNVKGRKIAVAPLEDAIQRHLQVEAVCLFSGLSDEGKEELVVAIESDRDLPKAELDAISRLDALARVVASFGGFRYSILKAFPRTQTGMSKVRRAALRKRLFKQ